MFSVRYCAGKGRGVFAKRRYGAGELIDWYPVLVIPSDQCVYINETVIYDYTYAWGENGEDSAIVLGFGSLYNHSYRPNAQYVRDLESVAMRYVALQVIEEGEEITVNYNGVPDDMSPVWFEVASV